VEFVDVLKIYTNFGKSPTGQKIRRRIFALDGSSDADPDV